MSEHDPLEMDTSALFEEFFSEKERLNVGSNQLANQLVSAIQSELSSTVVHQLVASMNELSARVEQDHSRLPELMDKMMAEAKADRELLVAALQQMSEMLGTQAEPIVNVTVPEPVVTVNVPETVVHVAPPEVNVHLPATNRKVTVKRDPLSGLIASADVEEVGDGR